MKIYVVLQRMIISAFMAVPKRIPVGGQAVIEGVLMKAQSIGDWQSENREAPYGSKPGLVLSGSKRHMEVSGHKRLCHHGRNDADRHEGFVNFC